MAPMIPYQSGQGKFIDPVIQEYSSNIQYLDIADSEPMEATC